MSELITVLLLTLMAGLAMPLGGLLACIEHIRPCWLENELRHAIIAFGGGALLAAIALVLVPDGIKHLSLIPAVVFFLLGGLGFMLLDIALYKFNTPASQLAAMLSDFLPESIALGAAFAMGGNTGILLAIIIALQNLPEGFNAYRELKQGSHFSGTRIILLFTLLALAGPVAGSIGYFYLAEQTQILAGIMLFAAGGILYSVFQDIAPQAKLDKHWLPTFGAVLGFTLGLAGYIVTNG
ncbi:divalent cation transporter [Catenovulum sp. 2E275]|uniref:ZIP family metal transporter n=1 Tax=Catenovulum sp. 2E275 TaxID=2980497 RepID=UPI0021CFCD6A|nr:divalent cation transporter [Catenovulum sp. 2E275]MCU4674474.1 divalent cation transporter [Catenovulum sp. 2E275]